jgi:hypothetical protein
LMNSKYPIGETILSFWKLKAFGALFFEIALLYW